MLKRLLCLLLGTLVTGQFLCAQVTTSSISGIVSTATNERLTGATVTALHVPTGSTYTTTSRTNGQFSINNMQPGGPYRITISYVGYEPNTRENIYLSLGEDQKVDFDLKNRSNELASVVVTGVRGAQKNGTETTIGRDKMENIPTVGRNLSDYLRATPQIRLSSGGNISSEGAMSFAGQNVRYNSFYIDGAVNNDVFGLAYSGTNGGQSGIAPISIDAIDQFQVAISPYNASLGNFTGAAINAITKSGTNAVHGSAYYIYRNQDLSGKTPTGLKSDATKIPDFSNKTFGATLGGPIIKNKLFYFLSAEWQRDQSPSVFTLASYEGTTKDAATLQRLVDTVQKRSNGFNVGGYANNRNETKADRITAKIDWNVNPANKLALSYRYNGGDRLVPLDNNSRALRFETNGYRFPTKTHSASAELKTNLQNNSSNRLLLTLTDVEDDRSPLGSETPIPAVQIFDGPVASIYFGTEASSTFNYLKQTTLNLVDHYRFTVGKNNFTVGVEGEYYKAFNSFIQNTAGNYRYLTLQDFFDNKAPDQYIVNYPLLGNDEKSTGSAANFKIFKGAAFFNDEIQAGKNLKLTLGIRADYYNFITEPIADRFAIDSALPKFAQYYNLKGGRPGQNPTVPVAISPRVGFNYQIPSENITVRGGFGMFAGRIPLVWPSAIYNNNGLSQGGYTLSSTQNASFRSKVQYRTIAYTPSELGLTLADAKGTLVINSEEFKMPKVFRTSLAIDKRFGNGWSTTIEGLYTRNINDVFYTNLNLLPPTLKMASGPDTRSVYPSPNTVPIRANGTNPYQAAYLISNAEGDKPFSYNFTATINKSSRDGLNMSLSYNYGESVVLNEAQSSTPGSQWNGMETVNGRNALTLSQSDNSAGHRIFGYVSKRFTYLNKKVSTTVSLTYTGESGQPFSYVYSGSNQVVRDGQTNNDLIYIPTEAQLQTITFTPTAFSGVTYTEAQQRAAFENFIRGNDYLRSRRGDYAERNGSRAPFSNILDLRIAQGFSINIGGKAYTAEIAYSMFNFTNFINRNWGRRYVVNFDNYGLLGFSYASATNLTPRYTFNPATPPAETVYNRFNPTYTARWLSQLEFRIRF